MIGKRAKVREQDKEGRRHEKRGPGKWQGDVKRTPEIDCSQEEDQCLMLV